MFKPVDVSVFGAVHLNSLNKIVGSSTLSHIASRDPVRTAIWLDEKVAALKITHCLNVACVADCSPFNITKLSSNDAQ